MKMKRNVQLYLTHENIESLKKQNINISNLVDNFLASYSLSPADLLDEAEELENKANKIRITVSQQQIKQRQFERKQTELNENPILIESLKLIKDNPGIAKGRANLIFNKTGIKITPEKLIEMANNDYPTKD